MKSQSTAKRTTKARVKKGKIADIGSGKKGKLASDRKESHRRRQRGCHLLLQSQVLLGWRIRAAAYVSYPTIIEPLPYLHETGEETMEIQTNQTRQPAFPPPAPSFGENDPGPSQPVPLDVVLKYTNRHVIRRYRKDFGGSQKQAETLFRETLKWLYLRYRQIVLGKDDAFDCIMTDHILKIDFMWHTFILFTRDYTEFCIRYFGWFMHHQPTTGEEPVLPKPEQEERWKLYFEFLYETLGEQTLLDWYDTERYAASEKKPVRKTAGQKR